MSPYEDRILDVKLVGGLSGSVTVTVEEGWADALLCLGLSVIRGICFLLFLVCCLVTSFLQCADLQRWRLLFLAFGIMLVLMAPIVSSWVPFYYSSSMAIGVCLVLIVLLFQVKLFIFSCGMVFLLSSLLCMYQNSLGLFPIYIVCTLKLVWDNRLICFNLLPLPVPVRSRAGCFWVYVGPYGPLAHSCPVNTGAFVKPKRLTGPTAHAKA